MFGVNLGTMMLKETIALHWTKSKTKLDMDVLNHCHLYIMYQWQKIIQQYIMFQRRILLLN